MVRNRLRAVPTVLLLAAGCGGKSPAESDAGHAESDAEHALLDTRSLDVADGNLLGIVADYATPTSCDHGLVLDPSRPEIAMYVWSSDLGCAEAMSGTSLGEIAEISILVRGARRGEVDFPPVTMAYPIGRSPDPDTIFLEPDTAGIQTNIAPAGSVRAESGVVVIEAIDADSVTFTVDALLEDGTPVRGRMTVSRACR